MLFGGPWIWLLSLLVGNVCAKEVLELQPTNFELALSSYKYIAVLFHDSSTRSQQLLHEWHRAATEVEALHQDGEVATIDATEPDAQELIEIYGLTVPSVRVSFSLLLTPVIPMTINRRSSVME